MRWASLSLLILYLCILYLCTVSGVSVRRAMRQVNHPSLSKPEWVAAAVHHRQELETLLYPPQDCIVWERRESAAQIPACDVKAPPPTVLRTKNVRVGNKDVSRSIDTHPVYNFLHVYYRYSASSLMKYSPGIQASIVGAQEEDSDTLHPRFLGIDNTDGMSSYRVRKRSEFRGAYKLKTIKRNRDLLRVVLDRPAYLGCYGLHEWALLYQNNCKHQQGLSLRVSQAVVDEVCETLPPKCTHFDAYRFFAKSAQPLNALQLTREMQMEKEQPGCIHTHMDLFKYAYQLYPLVSSSLLRATLRLAIQARKLDMRASPYDVSPYRGCEEAVAIETEEGRALFLLEQEALYVESQPLRKELLEAYDVALFQFECCSD